ncbi:ribonuclease inhibitor-like [Astyanax mexicanus]|uniref:ribonuclease inhibitor-like n=1 Tax=Astyanax mexicanus TaxID=7994 RepID=UPI0020CAB7E6|nr:ribonuclease inhibitor-like [Astyanax mexicanus]
MHWGCMVADSKIAATLKRQLQSRGPGCRRLEMKILWVILVAFSGLMETMSVRLKLVGAAAPLVAEAGEDLVLPCSLQPSISAEDMMVEWFRLHETDTLVHLYEDFEDRNGDQMESYRGRTALFKEELKKGNASLILSALQPSDDGAFKCLIRSFGWYDDVTLYVEVKGKGFHGWKIASICIFVFAVILTAFIAYILKDKYSEKQLSPIQCSVITYMRLHAENPRKELNLRKFRTTDKGYRRLIPAITNCRKAQLAGCNLTEKSIETLSTALQSENSALKELDLSNNNLQGSKMEKLSAALKSSNCKLEILRLSACKLSKHSFENLQSVLQSENSSLKELDLTNNNLEDSGMEKLSAGLKSSHCKLEILRLVTCKLSKQSIETLQSVLQSENNSLKELDLSNNDLQDSIEKLSAGLKSSHCKLETFRLALCNLGEQTCDSLGSVLKLETSLKVLDLSNNDLQDSGVEKLCSGLKSSHCKLETLRLSGCMITEKGCSSLASSLSLNLKELDLTYNNPGDSGVKELSVKMKDPHCKLSTLRVEHGGIIRMKTGLKKYGCDLTLDPNTAHPVLTLSEENRRVECGVRQPYPDHPERFDEWCQVLSRERVTGRCYWEAEFSRGGAVVALSYKTISRKGRGSDSGFGGNEKSWSLEIDNNRYFIHDNKNSYSVLHNDNRTALPPPPSPSFTVGVYVDCPAGTLSFYTISYHTHTPSSHTPSHTHPHTHPHTHTHLHTFYTTFTEALYAGFDVWGSLRICDIE